MQCWFKFVWLGYTLYLIHHHAYIPVEITDIVGNFTIAVPSQIILHGHFASSVFLWDHDDFIAHDARFVETCLASKAQEVKKTHVQRRRRNTSTAGFEVYRESGTGAAT